MKPVIDRQIVGFSDSKSLVLPENDNFVFLKTLINMSAKPYPKIVYIGAARGDRPERWELFETVCLKQGCQPTFLSLFNMVTDNPEDYFRGADIIFIDGGATRNLVALLKEWKMLDAVRAAYDRGVIMSGASAGINLFFEWCITDSLKTELKPLEVMGILKGSCCCHFDSQKDRLAVFDKTLAQGITSFPAYGLDEGVCVIYKNENLTSVLSLNPESDLHIKSENGNWARSKIKKIVQ